MSYNIKRTYSWNGKNDNGSVSGIQPTQRRKSLAPELLLPPIREGTPNSNCEISTESKGPSYISKEAAVSSLGSEREATGRTRKRGSVSSVSSVESSGSYKSNGRKQSLDKNEFVPRRKSVTRGTVKRQVSVSNLLQVGQKTSIHTIGTKVSTLIKARNAFSRLKKSTRSKKEEESDVEILEIKDLPKSPRFASTLSVEAQYAMLKGYEDIVYNNLCSSYPEYKTVLKRNRTPVSGVQVRNDCSQSDQGDGNRNEHANNKDCQKVCRSASSNASETQVTQRPIRETTKTDKPQLNEYISKNSSKDIPISVIRPSYSRHLPSTKTVHGHRHSGIARQQSASQLVPKEKQLVLTHRYQSAMDILDTVRTHTGVHTLSPRVKHKPQTMEPVKEFNSWAIVWNKEFQLNSSAAKT